VQINPDQSITLSIGSHTFDPPVQSVTCSSLFAALFLASVPGGFASAQCPLESWHDALPQGEPPFSSSVR